MLWGWITLFACGGETIIDFPDGLAPLDDENTAAWPANLAEAVNTNSGEGEELVWAHGRAYIAAPLADVYPCLREADINVDRRQAARWSVLPSEETEYEFSYQINIEIENIIDLEYTDTWRHGSTLDDDERIALTITSWQMTQGNAFMDIKRGSIVAEAVAADRTALDMIYHQKVARPDEAQMTGYLVDVHAELIACTAGAALPSYD